MRRILLLLAPSAVLATAADGQTLSGALPWLDALAQATAPGADPPLSAIGIECGGSYPDSLYLATPGANGGRPRSVNTPKMVGSRGEVRVPASADTVAVAVAAVRCGGFLRADGGRDLSAIVLGRDQLLVTYRPGMLGGDEPLPFLLMRSRDGSLRHPAWIGSRFLDQVGIELRKDSLAQAVAAKKDSLTRELAAKRAKLARLEAKRAAFIRSLGWPSRLAEAVIERRVVVGMNAGMVRAAWGDPVDVNTTVTAAGRHEQWVYGRGRYVYLDDGAVTAIQTSN